MLAYRKSTHVRVRRDGTTVLEAAVVLPVFFTFIFGLVEYGRVQMVANVINNACRQGARYGSTEGVTTAEATARVRQILGSAMDPDVVDIIVKDASVFDDGDALPETAADYQALSSIELDAAQPRQLFVVRATVEYQDIALVPISCLHGMKLTGQALMRHE
jgi:Flp pilus assembly protein TadG